MFTQARFKLTIWYLLILTFVSVLFSGMIYRVVKAELKRGYERSQHHLTMQELAFNRPLPEGIKAAITRDYNLAKQEVLTWLVIINGTILVFSAGASYFLAGKTLSPIQTAHESQKRFVADAAHELNTPITAIKTATEVAMRNKRLSLRSLRRTLADMTQEIDLLAELNQDLLGLVRLEQNGNHSHFTRVDVSEVIQSSLRRIKPLAQKKQIKILVKAENLVVVGDESGLAKLITILLDNAVKYTSKGGSVKLVTRMKGNKFMLSVIDTGIGIAESDLPYIFDRFYRAEASRTKEHAPGFGLGLAIAKHIVDLHKGKIKVESRQGKGTTFTVTLPQAS